MKENYDFSNAKRGPVLPAETGKTRITIRIDDDVLEHFRAQCAGGGSYQGLINKALRTYIAAGGDSLEQTLRRVIREELAA